MAAPSLIPQSFWFRLALGCPKIDKLPRRSGRLLDLPESCRLPATSTLAGQAAWAEVRTAWNPAGLGIAVGVTRRSKSKSRGVFSPVGSFESTSVQLWVDTRDTRDVHRATRFCHHVTAAIHSTGRGGEPVVAVRMAPIPRALANAPIDKADLIKSHAEARPDGWLLELFLPAEALNGFDAETNRRLGFAYQVTDSTLGVQFLGVGREFPIGEDPSLWATLELGDGG